MLQCPHSATRAERRPTVLQINEETWSVFMTANAIALYSIGHSNVTVEHLIALLSQHVIAMLCDVRSMPYSRYNPQFNRETLSDNLRPAGIAYRFMGDSLGGKSADGTLRTEDGALPDYAKIAASPLFNRGL